MATTQAMVTSFKVDLFNGYHAFSAAYRTQDVFKIALYTSAASLDATTTVYSATNEVVGTGYTAGGNTLTDIAPVSSGTTAYISFAATSWTIATFTVRGALIYNSSQGNKAVAVLDFGTDKSVVSGTFTITFPSADASNAILRIV